LEGPVIFDQLRLAGTQDIAAMKIAAITGRGSKKDFYDLSFMLDSMSLGMILELYQTKYPEASIYLALKSLIYFADADEQLDPEMLIPRSWNRIKKSISEVQQEYLDSLNN